VKETIRHGSKRQRGESKRLDEPRPASFVRFWETRSFQWPQTNLYERPLLAQTVSKRTATRIDEALSRRKLRLSLHMPNSKSPTSFIAED
jgi:hypothetical protein